MDRMLLHGLHEVSEMAETEVVNCTGPGGADDTVMLNLYCNTDSIELSEICVS
jgi:hypothetical protein